MTQQNNKSLTWGIALSLLGAVCFSTKAIIVKLAYRDLDVSAVSLLALRMVFSLPFFVLSAYITSSRQSNVRFTGRQWLFVAVIGCLGYYISSLLDFIGLQYVSAGIERLILFVYPSIVLLLSAVVFKEKIKPVQWLALGVTYAGLFIAFAGEATQLGRQSEGFYFGSLMILLCSITFATYIVGSGRLIPVVGAAKFNSYAMTFACIGVLLHFFVTSHESLLHLPMPVYGYSLLMAILSTVIPTFLISEGIKRIGSDNAAIVGTIGPVSTLVQAKIFLGEPLYGLQIVGTLLILSGILLIGRSRKVSVPSTAASVTK